MELHLGGEQIQGNCFLAESGVVDGCELTAVTGCLLPGVLEHIGNTKQEGMCTAYEMFHPGVIDYACEWADVGEEYQWTCCQFCCGQDDYDKGYMHSGNTGCRSQREGFPERWRSPSGATLTVEECQQLDGHALPKPFNDWVYCDAEVEKTWKAAMEANWRRYASDQKKEKYLSGGMAAGSEEWTDYVLSSL